MSAIALLPLLLVAHTAGLSGGDYAIRDGVLYGRLSFQRGELAALREAAGGDLARALDLQLSLPNRTCRPEGFESELEEEDGERVRFRSPCDLQDGEVLTLKLGFLEHAASGHRHFYEAKSGGALIEGVAYRGVSEIRLRTQGPSKTAWLGWALPIWLVFIALGLSLNTRRHTLEVFVAVGVTSLLLVGAGAASAVAPRGTWFGLVGPIFAFYLAAESYHLKRASRRVALAIPAGFIIAMIFLARALPEGAAEDRVVRGLLSLVSLALLPGGLALGASALASRRWPRAASVLVAAWALAMLLFTPR